MDLVSRASIVPVQPASSVVGHDQAGLETCIVRQLGVAMHELDPFVPLPARRFDLWFDSPGETVLHRSVSYALHCGPTKYTFF